MRAASIFLALCVACSSRVAVRGDVERGVPANELRIHLRATDNRAAPIPVERVEISTRNLGRGRGTQGSMRWAIARRPDAAALLLPAVIPYGTVPPGFGDSGSAPRLPNGQYELRVMAGGVWSVTPFRVTDQNTIE